MTVIPRTSLGRLATGSRGRPHFELLNNCFSSKNSSTCVKQRLLHLKNSVFIESSNFVLAHWRSRTLGPLVDLQGTSSGRHVLVGKFRNTK